MITCLKNQLLKFLLLKQTDEQPESSKIITKVAGFQHPKCFLKHTKNCSEQITAEHSISRGILKRVAQNDKTIIMGGGKHFSGTQKTVSIRGQAAKILCSAHNSQLSIFDSEALRLTNAIEQLSKPPTGTEQSMQSITIDGCLLERWALKMFIGLVHSRAIGPKDNKHGSIDKLCFKLLCDPNAIWPNGWGLYIPTSLEKIQISPRLVIDSKSNANTEELAVTKIDLFGFPLNFSLIHPMTISPRHREGLGNLRPEALVFVYGEFERHINFDWHGKQTTPKLAVTKQKD